MSDEGGDKSEEPTDKKLDDARKKGQVWKSKDFSGVIVFAACLGIVKAMSSRFEYEIRVLFQYSFEHMSDAANLQRSTFELLIMGLVALLMISLPVVLGGAILGGLSDFLQAGPLFTTDPLTPKLEKLNPIEGLKNMFSKKQLIELLKSMIKIGITGYITYGVIRDAIDLVVMSIRGDIPHIFALISELIFRVASRVILLFLIFAIFDLWFQRKTFMKEMMMSKDEVKREYKESEGDPHHKAKRKELHQEILEGAQMDAVKGADVVVTNPDHVAVALKYDRNADEAPRVLAKGLDAKAERIKEIAKQGDVAILRNVPLAHALLRVEPGQQIPEDLYDAVAEVLNFVYGLKSGYNP
jgi:flagellar biosynthetic protein FlhB